MANPVASVISVQGQAWVKGPDGNLRPLKAGDKLMADEVVVTGEGARVELNFGEGQPVVITANQQVGLSQDLWQETAADASEAQLADASVQQALTILEEGGDLLEALEETAAGGGEAGAGGGNSFVQVDRISASADGNPEFAYGDPSFAGSAGGYGGGDQQNQAPSAEDLQVTLEEDTSYSGRILAADPENDSLTYTLLTPPANGSLTLDPATGEFVYQPNENYNGSDSFLVVVTDPRGNSATSTVTLDITPVNDAPTSDDLSLQTPEDVPVSGQIEAEDVDGDSLTYTIGTGPANGSVTLDPETGSFTYTPNPDYHGNDSFVVIIDDGQGGTTTSTVNLVVTPVNDAPEASDLHLVTPEDTPIDGQISASDVDGDSLGFTLLTPPTNGSLVLDPVTGQFTYTPNQDYNGSDSFVVTVDDGHGGTTTSTVTIGVLPVNDAPVTSNIHLTTPEDTPVSSQVVATDVDGDTLSYLISSQPAHGSVSLNPATGQFTYTPNASYNGGDSFVVTVSDGNGGTTTSIVTIGVLPVNDAPVAANLNLTTPMETPVSGQVSAFDPDGDTLTFTLVSGPANGSVNLNPATGAFVFTPDTGFSGSTSFVVSVSDGNGGVATSLVTIGVTDVTVPSVVVNIVDEALVAGETSEVTFTFSEAVQGFDLSDLVIQGGDVSDLSGPVFNGDGTVTYTATFTPAENFTGTASVEVPEGSYTDLSGNLGLGDSDTVALDTAAPSVIVDIAEASLAAGETSVVTFTFSEAITGFDESDLIIEGGSIEDLTGPVVNGDGTVTYTATFIPADGFTGAASVEVVDGSYTDLAGNPGSGDQDLVGVDTVLPSVVVDIVETSLIAGETSEVTFTFSKEITGFDLDDLVVTGGKVTDLSDPVDNGDGTFTYTATFTPDADFTGTASVEVPTNSYTDLAGNPGFGDSDTVALDTSAPSVVVNITADELVAGEATEVTFTFSEAVAGFDLADVEFVGGEVTGLSGPQDNGDGTFTYTATFTPAADFTGTASVSVIDGSYTDLAGNSGSGDSDSVEILLNPNLAPEAGDDNGSAAYSVTVQFTNTNGEPGWTGLDSTGQSVNIQAFNADGTPGVLVVAAPSTSSNGLVRLGIGGSPRPAGTQAANEEPTQIEYDPESNTSETLMITLNGLASGGTFSVANLYANENGGEMGQWTAYYQGQVVATSAFVLTTGDAGTFTIDTNGMLFDSVGFSALHNREGTGDGGGYFLTEFTATGPSPDYLVAEGDQLNITLADNHLLANDTDPDGDALSVTHINGVAITDGQTITLASGASLTIYTDGSFSYSPNGAFAELAWGERGTDTFEYTVSDGRGGVDVGQVSLTIVGSAAPLGSEISSTPEADTMVGTLLADTFVWNLGDAGTAGDAVVDVVEDFNASQGDVLDLRDLLIDENAGNLGNYLYATTDGTTTSIHISSTGGYADGYDPGQTDQIIQLQNVHFHNIGNTSEEIISMLKNAGNLLTD